MKVKRRKNKPPTKSAVDYIELLYNKYAPKLNVRRQNVGGTNRTLF